MAIQGKIVINTEDGIQGEPIGVDSIIPHQCTALHLKAEYIYGVFRSYMYKTSTFDSEDHAAKKAEVYISSRLLDKG
jgi:3-isopropylmalate dehydratase small subunit